ncbi:MAG TPA: hypothetical protein VIL15_05840 [Coriobacteriia bacterium]
MTEIEPVTTIDEPAAVRANPALPVRLLVDLGVALLWAALVVAIVLFSGAVSQFAYVDF